MLLAWTSRSCNEDVRVALGTGAGWRERGWVVLDVRGMEDSRREGEKERKTKAYI